MIVEGFDERKPVGADHDHAPGMPLIAALQPADGRLPVAEHHIGSRGGQIGHTARVRVHLWYNQMNDSFKDELALLGRRAGNTWGFELYYNVAINKWLRFTADLQLAQNANKDDDFAVIPGGRLVLEF